MTHDALAQVEAGADMLDVNAGIPLVDEAELLKTMLRTVQQAVDVPICIDSSVIEALEAGLSVYEGRALVNSVTAEDERLSEILPLVARYDAAVIGLANDETGIPETPEKRLECARKIVSVAADYGIARDDVVIDPLAMTVGADPSAVRTTLDDDQPDPRRARREHVPRRVERLVRPAAAARAQRRLPADGDGGRADQRDHVDRPRCASTRSGRRDLLLGHDEWGANWIAAHRARQATVAAGGARVVSGVSPQRRRLELAQAPGAVDPSSVRRRRAGPAAVPARRRGGPRPERHARVRRGELERDRDRLDLRRPRDVQEVPRADRVGRRPGRAPRPARVLGRRAARGLAARVPRVRARRPGRRGAAAADSAEGGAGRASGAT